MKKIITPMLLLLVLSLSASILNSFKGTVLDANSKTPIKGAVIKSFPSKTSSVSDLSGHFTHPAPATDTLLEITAFGYQTKRVKIDKRQQYQISLQSVSLVLNDQGSLTPPKNSLQETLVRRSPNQAIATQGAVAPMMTKNHFNPIHQSINMPFNQANSESYQGISENTFKRVREVPLSTFSIDVDAASYSNVRRFIQNGNLPPKDAVRIEEMINYFDYQYAQPKGNDPIQLETEIAPAPWNKDHKLLSISLQAKKIDTDKLPASNLVFLIDVSGSMNSANKLPLLISSLKLLTDQLRPIDKVAIVVYAGSSGLVLPATSGDAKTKIKEALNKLQAGGSTAGEQGIKLAYQVAAENYIKGGNNRIILASDGDFNVGASSDSEMEKLIVEKRKSGIFLTILGYGMGNYKDSKMEILANKGNGNYAYIDNINEARKVLINEFGGTLFTVAKDVKLQLEFNPSKVQAYRLIGYENRLLKDEDFNNDRKDAGELGAGHTVTALYEIIPFGVTSKFANTVDELKYQKPVLTPNVSKSEDLLTIKIRYKKPDEEVSKRMEKEVYATQTTKLSNNFKFAAAVAEFGMLLRDSDFKQNSSYDQVISLANSAKGEDKDGYRTEFINLVKSAQLLARDFLTFVK